MTRRGFLSASAAVVAAPWLRSVVPPTNDRFLTFINLMGGNDGLNTLVPTRLQAYARQRPGIAIAPAAGLPLDTGPYADPDHVLHPALPTIARLYREGYAAFVRMVGYAGSNLSHFTSQDVWSRGAIAPTEPDSGWIARYKDLYAREVINVVALGLNGQLDFRGGETGVTFSLIPPDPATRPPYVFTGDARFPANDRLRFSLAEQVAERMRAEGLPARARASQLAALGQLEELRRTSPPATRPEYPRSSLGAVLSSSAQMLRQELPVKIFYAVAGTAQAFDTHYDQGGVQGRHATSLGGVDDALAAYTDELRQMGVWNRAVIVLFSEFGRRNAAFGNGTDHGAGGLMILLGGAVRGGMFGPDLTEEAVNAANLPVRVDFRTVYEELLARHFEVDPVPVFVESYARQPPLGVLL
jgi:uncharacterized protein (DUF1501 family)